ncbi:MAG: polymerase beta domain protein region [Chitinophagaceae bacterium]|nr:polymerase beta domain protein region [Chitinophagaceae bacterium]
MKTTLSHLPQQKQEEIAAITETLRLMTEPEMIILFGSYSRGDWQEDVYIEDNITYSYNSDFDLLVVVKDEKKAAYKERKILHKLRSHLHHELPVQVIVHGIDYLNKQLEEGQYFFTDIMKEGTMLFDTHMYTLAEPKELSAKQRANISQMYFDKWFADAVKFFEGVEFYMDKEYLSQAAFLLHQTTERFLNTVGLVFTHYRPKTHDLVILYKAACLHDERFKIAFPLRDEEERRLFKILNAAYIDSRYKLNYSVTRDDLEYLSERVEVLREITEVVCGEKIEGITNK